MHANQNRHDRETRKSLLEAGSTARIARAGSVCVANSPPRRVLPTPSWPDSDRTPTSATWSSALVVALGSLEERAWVLDTELHRQPYKPARVVQQNRGETEVSLTPMVTSASYPLRA
jgi:hypothetical protein